MQMTPARAAVTASLVKQVRAVVQRHPRLQTLNRRRRLVTNRPRLARLAPTAPPRAAEQRRRVLIATNIGGFLTGSTVEATLAAALIARGHDVHVVLCDSTLPACLECTINRLGTAEHMAEHGPRRRLCQGCFRAGRKTYLEVGATLHRMSDLLTSADWAAAADAAAAVHGTDVEHLEVDGLSIGEHAKAGALRFFARATIDEEPGAEAVLRRYASAAVLTARAFRRLVQQHHFDVAVFHHGIYVPQGVVGDVCRDEGVRVVNWNPGYRARTFIFSEGDTYHHTLLDEPNETWESYGWDARREADVMAYLETRWTGASDWIWFHQHRDADRVELAAATGLDPQKPWIGLLTNVMWDAQLHYPANAFENMREWIVDTIGWFTNHPELQLLVRVHPAESTGSVPSRQRVVDEIAAAFPELPPNIAVVGPENPLGTYAAMRACDSAIIYGTKTGVELTAMGIPVVVAGEAWIRGKGVTTDVSSVQDYHRVLERLPFGRRLDEQTVRRARQYAYHFFFRRMIPLQFMAPTGGDPVCHNTLTSADGLLPGRDRGLDVILDGILSGTPFVYPSDEVGATTG